MKYVLTAYEPQKLFRFYEELSAIPRESKHEEAAADYLVKFAEERNLYCYRDAVHNVFIKKPATSGKEHLPAILLQGHTDMVCEKNNDSNHDFSKDPLDLYVKDGFLRARGTTLGADNGLAVAMMLAVLDGEVSEHRAIECLFTSQEEIGLIGAKEFDYSLVSATEMLNLDSEEEGEVITSCAGGLRSDFIKPYDKIPFVGEAVAISISGLYGGHSGVDVNKGRNNANRLLARLLSVVDENLKYNIVKIKGGSKDNAIPREAEVTIAISNVDKAKVQEILTKFEKDIKGEISSEDENFAVSYKEIANCEYMTSVETTKDILGLLNVIQTGVLAMSNNVKGLVEFSRNLGVLVTKDDKFVFTYSTRSPIESQIDYSAKTLDLAAGAFGFETRHYSRYPGWAFMKNSPLRDRYLEIYKNKTGKTSKMSAMHAGLECGLVKANLPEIDIISIGPDLFDPHSPDERLDIASFQRTWEIVAELVK